MLPPRRDHVGHHHGLAELGRRWNGGWYPAILDGAVREAATKRLAVIQAGDGGGTVTSAGFFAYDPGFTGGAHVAAGR